MASAQQQHATQHNVACRLRDEIESEMQQDISLKLVIAIQTALADSRYEARAQPLDLLPANLTAFDRVVIS